MSRRLDRRQTRATGPADDAGMVTAELAIAIPALVFALVLAVFAVAAQTARLRCADAAQVAARMAARGESPAVVTASARAIAPADARVTVHTVGGEVHVTVSARLRLPGTPGALPGLTVSAAFVEPREPGSER